MSNAVATPTAQNPLLVLLDFVASPLLLFNAQAQVVFSNQAAKQMACRPALLLGSDPNVRGLVRDIAAGKTVLHLDMRVDALSDNGVARLQCRCAPRPIAGMVAMAVNEVAQDADTGSAAPAPAAAERLSLQQIMELIRTELDPPIRQLLAQATPAGPAPLSEPESKYLHDEMERFKPDLIVSIHAPYGMLDFDGPSVPPARLGRLYLDQIGIFPGSLGNFGGIHKGMPVVTIELNSAIRTPLDSEMRQMWLDLLRWMSERLRPEGAPAGPVPVKVRKSG